MRCRGWGIYCQTSRVFRLGFLFTYFWKIALNLKRSTWFCNVPHILKNTQDFFYYKQLIFTASSAIQQMICKYEFDESATEISEFA